MILWLLALNRHLPSAKRLYAVVQPGFVNTPMGEEALVQGSLGHLAVRFFKRVFAKSPWQGAQTVLHVATEPNLPPDPVARPWANNAHWQFWNPQIASIELQQLVWDRAQVRPSRFARLHNLTRPTDAGTVAAGCQSQALG
jgi:hypothetical protein